MILRSQRCVSKNIVTPRDVRRSGRGGPCWLSDLLHASSEGCIGSATDEPPRKFLLTASRSFSRFAKERFALPLWVSSQSPETN